MGFLQLQEVYQHSVVTARSLAFYNQPLVHSRMKWRLPGDTLIILGAFLLFVEVARLAWSRQRTNALKQD